MLNSCCGNNSLKAMALFVSCALFTACSSDDEKHVSSSGPPVSVADTVFGEVVTDRAGRTLYTFNNDQKGVSNCEDGCAQKWQPLAATDDALANVPYTVINRSDGSRQWALHEWPLYYWQNDVVAGDVLGEEVGGVWFVAQSLPVSKRVVSVETAGVSNSATVITDSDAMALYMFNNDRNAPGGSACNGGCAQSWPPLLAEAGSQAQGDFALVIRDDQSLQWAYRGNPLYRWGGDSVGGDATGEAVGGVWFVAQPLPFSKFTTSTEGVVITDANWMTSYTLSGESPDNLICTGACLAAWPPVLAAVGEIDRGDYTVFENSAGARQWVYKNQPVYLWSGDNAPGDAEGQGLAHGSGSVWAVTAP